MGVGLVATDGLSGHAYARQPLRGSATLGETTRPPGGGGEQSARQHASLSQKGNRPAEPGNGLDTGIAATRGEPRASHHGSLSATNGLNNGLARTRVSDETDHPALSRLFTWRNRRALPRWWSVV